MLTIEMQVMWNTVQKYLHCIGKELDSE